MRDSRRFLFAVLNVALDTHPSLRLGQLIDNAITCYKEAHPEFQTDLFYIEDIELARIIDWCLNTDWGRA